MVQGQNTDLDPGSLTGTDMPGNQRTEQPDTLSENRSLGSIVSNTHQEDQDIQTDDSSSARLSDPELRTDPSIGSRTRFTCTSCGHTTLSLSPTRFSTCEGLKSLLGLGLHLGFVGCISLALGDPANSEFPAFITDYPSVSRIAAGGSVYRAYLYAGDLGAWCRGRRECVACGEISAGEIPVSARE